MWISQAYNFRELALNLDIYKVPYKNGASLLWLHILFLILVLFHYSTAGERRGTTGRGARVPPSQRETEENYSVGFRRKRSVTVRGVGLEGTEYTGHSCKQGPQRYCNE